MKKITTLFLALTCVAGSMSVIAQDDFTKGTDYHLIVLDDVTLEGITAANIKQDFRVDDANHFLYIWDNTYASDNAIGPNWNGEEGFIALTVGNAGWSGCGFSGPAAKDMTAVTKDYTLHIAMKSNDAASHIIGMGGPGGLEARINVGATAFVDGTKTYQPYTNFARDGKWQLVEIPMSAYFDLGLRYPEAVPAYANVVYFLSGGTPGTKIAFDALFVYKKVTTGVNDANENQLQVITTKNVITIPGNQGGFELYSISGAKIKTTQDALMDIEGLSKGVYLVKAQNQVQKIVIR